MKKIRANKFGLNIGFFVYLFLLTGDIDALEYYHESCLQELLNKTHWTESSPCLGYEKSEESIIKDLQKSINDKKPWEEINLILLKFLPESKDIDIDLFSIESSKWTSDENTKKKDLKVARICNDILLYAAKETKDISLFSSLLNTCSPWIDYDRSLMTVIEYGDLIHLQTLFVNAASRNTFPTITGRHIKQIFYSKREDLLHFLLQMTEMNLEILQFTGGGDISVVHNILEVVLVTDDLCLIKKVVDSKFKYLVGINLCRPPCKNDSELKKISNKESLTRTLEHHIYIYHPLFVALSGRNGFGQVYKGSSLDVIKFLVSEGAEFSKAAMKNFSPYSLVNASKRSLKEKEEIKEYLKSIQVKDIGDRYHYDYYKESMHGYNKIKFFYIVQ